jgi:IS30 family transposase
LACTPGESFAAIAARLGKATSTVSREVAAGGGRTRLSGVAGAPARPEQARRPKTPKLAHPPLAERVSRWLAAWWSPVQVSARLPMRVPRRSDDAVSHETIYQAPYVQGRGELRRELPRLPADRAGQAPPAGRGGHTGQLRDLVMIGQRPAEAADRGVPGHWEGDLLIGKDCHSAVGTLVERATRYVMLLHLPAGRDAHLVERAMRRAIGGLPGELARTITWDQGKEMAFHAQFTIATGIGVSCCDPHKPWQRGSNENTNGLLRQYLPKGTDLSVHAAADLARIARSLNDRPRKTLGYMTPSEKLAEFLAHTG